jgi:hypothetical protein
MAHLWVKNATEQWAVLPLEETAFTLTANPPHSIGSLVEENNVLANVLLLRTAEAERTWVLVAGSGTGVSVNGMPLVTGIRVVGDRDEIRVPGSGSFYFSTETLARVEEFVAAEQTLFCPRCKQAIEAGAAAVKCPGCGVWHHQTEDLNCWTYSDICALCTNKTDLNGSFRWTPEEL